MNPSCRPLRTRADTRRATKQAVRQGVLARPDRCEECGHAPRPFRTGRRASIEAHHPDYNEPMQVLWLCRDCHRAWHRLHSAVAIEGERPEDGPIQISLRGEFGREIRKSLRSFGYTKVGTGVSDVLFTFAMSDEVQRVVRKHLGIHAPVPAE